MMERERMRQEEKRAQQQEELQTFDQKQQQGLKRGKILVITAAVLSLISVLPLLAGSMMLFGEGDAVGAGSALLVAIACGVFPAFMIAGFNWARDGFIVTQAVKAIALLGVLLKGEYRAYLTAEIVVLLILWIAFYVAEIVVFGFYQQIREYQYDRLTRPEPFE